MIRTKSKRPPDPAREARRNFRRLSRARQVDLTHELAETLAPLLQRAYPALQAVGAGYRLRREGRQYRRVLEPCLVFVVARKWPAGRGERLPDRLPDHLMAYADIDGRRETCAVPTDVQPRRLLGMAVAHQSLEVSDFPYGIAVERPGSDELSVGVACCGLRRPVAPGQLFLLSCRHVLGRELVDEQPSAKPMPVTLNRDPPVTVSRTTLVRGRLNDSGSCDAQLAAPAPQATKPPSAALTGLRFDGPNAYAQAPSDIGADFWIHTGRADAQGRRLRARVENRGAIFDHGIDYETPAGDVRYVHRRLLRGESEIPLTHGDSGSPATSRRDGGMLLGMYIGGSDTTGYFIPAWQLFLPANFGASSESDWTLDS